MVSRGIRRVYLVAYSPLTRVHLIPIYRVFGNENYSASTGVVYTKTLDVTMKQKNKKHVDKDIIQTSCMRVQLNYQVIRKRKTHNLVRRKEHMKLPVYVFSCVCSLSMRS